MDEVWIIVVPIVALVGLYMSNHYKDQKRLELAKACYEQMHDVEKCNKQVKELIRD